MPLPTRATSIRTTSNDSNKPAPRLTQPTQTSQLHIQKSDGSSKKSNGLPSEEAKSPDALIKDSISGGKPSSRIPSPFKRNPSSQSAYSQQTDTSQPKPPPRGHARQRSAVLPPLSARQKLGHSRSISAVSVNTVSTSDSHAPRPNLKSAFTASQLQFSPSKLQQLPEHRTGLATASSLRPTTAQPHLEPLQNELLQLSIVHRQSSQGTAALQRSIDKALAAKKAVLTAVLSDVREKKQSFSTALNLTAVDMWLQAEGYQRTCQSIQNFSVAVRDLQHLETILEGDDGLAAAFQRWQREITSDHTPDHVSLHLIFQNELAPELRRFKQQLVSSLATLSNLPDCSADSALYLMLQGHQSMANSMMSQCQIMIRVGDLLTERHRQWLDQEVSTAIDDLGHDSQKRTVSTPVWDL